MKAVRIHQHGDIDQLRYEDAPDPELSPSDVLVRVKACALNHLDIWTRQGRAGVKVPMPHILGSDVAGVVEAVGNAVTDTPIGMPVVVSPGISCGKCEACLSGQDNLCPSYNILGTITDGGYAELVKVPAVNVLAKPLDLTFEEAAAVPLVFLTAWHMLVGRARVQPGETVLVQAAGSGVGSAAIQIAKLFNARVITTASSDEKLEKARQLGADELINYVQKDFQTEVRRLTTGQGVDVVIEHVGAATFENSVRVLARNGRLVTCGATAGPEANIDLRYVFSRHLNILGSYMGSKAELIEVLKFFPTGQLKPVVYQALPLSEAALAQELMQDRRNFGKIVLSI